MGQIALGLVAYNRSLLKSHKRPFLPPQRKGRRRMYKYWNHIQCSKTHAGAARRSRDPGKSRLAAPLNAHSQMCSLSEMAGALAAPLKSLSLCVFVSFLSSSSLCVGKCCLCVYLPISDSHALSLFAGIKLSFVISFSKEDKGRK